MNKNLISHCFHNQFIISFFFFLKQKAKNVTNRQQLIVVFIIYEVEFKSFKILSGQIKQAIWIIFEYVSYGKWKQTFFIIFWLLIDESIIQV